MTLRTRRILQQIILFAVIFAMLMAENSLVSLNVRLLMTAVALGAAIVIVTRRLRDADLLFSPLDFGWVPYILLTAVTVLLAPSPRRSLEVWLWLIGIQLPMAYGALYLFRRRWPERGLYRALLGAGGYLYLLTLVLTLNYLSQVAAAKAAGLTPPGFRLFEILDHPNIFAMFIAVATPCILAYAFTQMGRLERIGVVVWLAGAALAIYGTGSRTGTVALMVGSAVALTLALLAHPARPVQRFRTWMTAHRSQAIAAIAAAVIVLLIGVGVVIKLQFGRPAQDDGGGRISFYRSALNMFVSSPIAGSGPGGFFRNQIQTISAPPNSPMPNAHDMVLSAASESGLLGLIGFVSLLAASVWTCIRVWREQPTRRALIAGPIGGLIAFCINGILDSPINQFSAFFMATVVLAYVAAQLPAPQTVKARHVRAGFIVLSVWVVALLCVVVLIPYTSLWAVMNPEHPLDSPAAILAGAQKLDSVIAYDKTDPLVMLQSGYFWAAIDAGGNDTGSALLTAINRFERGTQLDPDLSINWLNLSALDLEAHRPTNAVEAAQRSVALAGNDPVGWLNLGIAIEARSQAINQAVAPVDADAQAAYLKALQLAPYWQEAGFWRSSATRQAALNDYISQSNLNNNYYWVVSRGNSERLAGNKDAALRDYQQALTNAPSSVAKSYIDGLIALTNGDQASATKSLTQATQMGGPSNDDQIASTDAWLALGDLAQSSGKKDEMLKDYGLAYGILTSRGMYGFGTKGDWGYALVGYQRFGRISDYLPQVVTLDITADQVQDFVALAKESDPADAAGIYQQLLGSNPGNTDIKAPTLP